MKIDKIKMTDNSIPFDRVFNCAAWLVDLVVGPFDVGISEGLVIFACSVGLIIWYTLFSGYFVEVLLLGKLLHISLAWIIRMGFFVLLTLHLKKKASYCRDHKMRIVRGACVLFPVDFSPSA